MSSSFMVEFDLKSIENFMLEVQYDAICDHLKRLAMLESSIHDQRCRLFTVARELEGKILYSRKETKEVNCEINS